MGYVLKHSDGSYAKGKYGSTKHIEEARVYTTRGVYGRECPGDTLVAVQVVVKEVAIIKQY